MTAACPELAFEIVLRLAPGRGVREAWRDAFVAALDARGLSATGGGDAPRYLITRDGGQAVDADREAMRAWAEQRPEVLSVAVGPLIDLREAAT